MGLGHYYTVVCFTISTSAVFSRNFARRLWQWTSPERQVF